jgi:hypothetical protein
LRMDKHYTGPVGTNRIEILNINPPRAKGGKADSPCD